MAKAQSILIAAFAAAGLGLLFLLWHLHPAEWPWAPQCVFHATTGLHCAGCGATRATHFLLQGEWRTAMQYNGLWVCSLPVLGLVIVFHHVQRHKGKPGINAWPWGRLMVALFVLLTGYWLLRNIPGYPFELLAPPG